MTEIRFSLVDLGKLSEPATKLIEAVQSAVGVVYEPTKIRRRAKAETDAAIMFAKSRRGITDLERRAARRLGTLERRRQANIDAITGKALAALPAAVSPNPVEDDWVFRFFGECQDVSDEEMQVIWARILAAEVARPGSFGPRTLSIVRNLTRRDAEAFSKLAALAWSVSDDTVFFVKEFRGPAFEPFGLTFEDLLQLQSLGLIQAQVSGIYTVKPKERRFHAYYFNACYTMELPDGMAKLDGGCVVATVAGRELIRVCPRSPNEIYRDESLAYVAEQGLRVTPVNSSEPSPLIS